MAAKTAVRLPRTARPSPDKRPEHHVHKNGKTVGFRNPWDSWNEMASPATFFRARISGELFFAKAGTDIESYVKWQTPVFAGHEPTSIKACWLGHASLYFELPAVGERGLRVLCDPVFSQRCSPSQWMGPKRYTQPPAPVKDLPEIDIVLISHNHYDHLDIDTIKELVARFPEAHFMTSLGNLDWFKQAGVKNVTELDWWEERIVTVQGRSARLGYLPAQHMTGRFVTDQGATLWGSWSIEAVEDEESESGRRIFFAGDTGRRTIKKGMTDVEIASLPVCPAHKQIGDLRGPFELAAVPIGAYAPRFLMSPVHVDAGEAIDLFKELNAKQAFAIHWGTFSLSAEDVVEPAEKLVELCAQQDIKIFTCWPMGEVRQV